MGWITDWFDDIHLPTEISAKLDVLESQFTVLESENVKLKIENQNLEDEVAIKERENQRLQTDTYKTKTFPHTDLLGEPKQQLMLALSRSGEVSPPMLADMKPGDHHENAKHMRELEEQGYIQIGQPIPPTKLERLVSPTRAKDILMRTFYAEAG